MPVPTHSVAGGRGTEGGKGGLARRMVAEANVRKVGTIRGGGDAPSRCHWPTDGQGLDYYYFQSSPLLLPLPPSDGQWHHILEIELHLVLSVLGVSDVCTCIAVCYLPYNIFIVIFNT